MKLSLRFTILLGFLSILLLLGCASIYLFFQVNSSKTIAYESLQYSKRMKLLNNFALKLDTLESQIDTFFVTPYSQYLDKSVESLEDMLVISKNLEELTVEKKRLREFQENIQEAYVLLPRIFLSLIHI